MRTIFTTILLLALCMAQAQENKPETVLEAPDSWRPEIINFPLGFAPSLKYSGFEDIRFAPGWADTTAADYFTYTFTWVLDKDPKLDKAKLERQMKAYFDGLMAAVSERDDLPKTQASFNFADAKRDFAASGEVSFYEAFFSKKVISLQIRVAGKACKEEKKYLVRFELSPTSDEAIWGKFKEVKLAMACDF